MAPVRLGMVKPSTFVQTNDVLEVIERFLYSEKDLSTLLSNNKDSLAYNKRKKVEFIFLICKYFINKI